MSRAEMALGLLLILPRMMRCWASVVIRRSSVVKSTTHEPRPANNETGYSLTEVMASITILAIAIIPMVGMFDTGLRAAGASGDYDKARALANLVLEEAKGLSYEDVRNDPPPAATDSEDFAGFEYELKKQYLKRPPTGSSSEPAPPKQTFTQSEEDEGLIRLTVTVSWSEGKTYTATGLVADTP